MDICPDRALKGTITPWWKRSVLKKGIVPPWWENPQKKGYPWAKVAVLVTSTQCKPVNLHYFPVLKWAVFEISKVELPTSVTSENKTRGSFYLFICTPRHPSIGTIIQCLCRLLSSFFYTTIEPPVQPYNRGRPNIAASQIYICTATTGLYPAGAKHDMVNDRADAATIRRLLHRQIGSTVELHTD